MIAQKMIRFPRNSIRANAYPASEVTTSTSTMCAVAATMLLRNQRSTGVASELAVTISV